MRRGIMGLMFGALALFGATRAEAVPVFSNPNFSSGAFDPISHYGFPDDWAFTGFGPGSAPQDVSSFWDNGAAPGGVSTVGFLQNIPSTQSAFSQYVGGFVVGNSYTISIAANARTPVPAVLQILLDGASTLLLSVVAPVNASGTFTTPFGNYVSASFVAAATSNTITFMNSSAGVDSTLLLTNASISDVTPVASVPEPISIAILGIGLVGLGFARRNGTI